MQSEMERSSWTTNPRTPKPHKGKGQPVRRSRGSYGSQNTSTSLRWPLSGGGHIEVSGAVIKTAPEAPMYPHLSFVRSFSAKQGLCPSDADPVVFPPPLASSKSQEEI
jgi:hypothetical protein